jgi:transposase InsO family protein
MKEVVMSTEMARRQKSIHLWKSGHKMKEIVKKCERSERWVYKWRARYEELGWAGLQSQSKAPRKHGTKYSDRIRAVIIETRSELEAGQALGTQLKYIGAPAIRTELKGKKLKRTPSRATIERVLREGDMTNKKEAVKEVVYPHLKASQPYQLLQVDIVPHYLKGGARAACFNALDVYSKYPVGKAYPRRRSTDAADFLRLVWQEIGVAHYTQVDNEACFSGGSTHPYVLGKVLRLALTVGTELLFSPFYHPQSNAYVERFHQDYNRHVWQDTYLSGFKQINAHAKTFLEQYRQRPHHSALKGQTPAQVHHQDPGYKLKPSFALAKTKRPLYAGRVHFLRKVEAPKQVSVLNVIWPVPKAEPEQGVWVTIDFQPEQTTLSVYDTAPGADKRRCLACHPFPLTEPVLPIPDQHFNQIYVNYNSA